MRDKIKKNAPWLLLVLILILGAFLRLYRISDYMLFLGDEGRDVLIVKGMLVDHKLTLLGPTTSVGAMFLGPIYYYFMVPFLWLSRLDPVGPAIMVALFSLATILLIYKFSADFFDKKMGLATALLYAVSPLVITYSHSSWNPNPLPFFSLLIIYGLAKVVVGKKDRWLAVVGMAQGIAIQLHYLALIFFPLIFVVLALRRFKISFKDYLLGLTAFLLSYSPFLIFELRHNFPNLQTAFRFIAKDNPASPGTFNFGFDRFLHTLNDISVRLFWRLITIESNLLAKGLLLLVIFGVFYWLWQYKKQEREKFISLLILVAWYIIGVGGLSLYRGAIYDYYFVYLFPLPFLLTGFMISAAWRYRLGRWLAVFFIVYLLIVNLRNTPISRPPNKLVAQAKEISQFVLDKTEGKPYNFALIASHNTDQAYRYFLEIWRSPPVIIENPDIDPKRQTVTNQLLVVCEEKNCQPLGHPLWQIAGFGRAEIENEWSVGPVRIFKLGHYKGT